MDSSCISFQLQKDDQLLQQQQQLGFVSLKNIENLQLYYSTCRTATAAAGLELQSSPDDELVVNQLVEDNALHQRGRKYKSRNALEAIRPTCKGPRWSVIHYLVLEQGEKKGNINSDDPVYDVVDEL